MSYITLALVLGGCVSLFIAGLLVIRRIYPGDYTALKVVVGVGLVEAARWHWSAQAGVSYALRLELFGLMALAGALICAWQLAEWARRQSERVSRRITRLEDRHGPPPAGGR